LLFLLGLGGNLTNVDGLQISDVLRVHEYEYVREIMLNAGAADPNVNASGAVGLRSLDGDTTISR
jgi:hypothetical protein